MKSHSKPSIHDITNKKVNPEGHSRRESEEAFNLMGSGPINSSFD